MLRKTKGFEQISHKPFPVLNKRPQEAAIWFPVTAKTLAVSSRDLFKITALSLSRGCARGTGGCIHSTPNRSSSRDRKNGDASARGCMAAQTSWRKPGRVSSFVRMPPPIVSPASRRRTDRFSLAMVMAAASPLGPDPTTTASYS